MHHVVVVIIFGRFYPFIKIFSFLLNAEDDWLYLLPFL